MIKIFFVGDGLRDMVILPPLVGNILSVEFEANGKHWAHLHGAGRGYAKKLKFAVLQAKDDSAQALIATVDRDKAKAKERLGELKKARAQLRASDLPYPTALGEARPHAEAWLLDDPVAVCRCLNVSAESIPSIRHCSDPKSTLDNLHRGSSRSVEAATEVITEIASLLEPRRCVHADETGFAAFVADVKAELSSLVK